MTYRSPSVIKTPERLYHHQQQPQQNHHRPLVTGAPPLGLAMRHHGGLTRGLSLGELSPRNQGLPIGIDTFDTKKVATHGTLKRLKLVRSPTDTQLFVPNQQMASPTFDPSSGKRLLYYIFMMQWSIIHSICRIHVDVVDGRFRGQNEVVARSKLFRR